MKAAIEKQFPGIEIEMIPSGGGVFEVQKDGKLIFSKKATGRFPEIDEIISALS